MKENYVSTEVAIKSLKHNAKCWVKENKFIAGLTGVAVAMGIGTIAIWKHLADIENSSIEHEAEGIDILNTFLDSKNNRIVDEDLFTDIAPQMEELIFNDGVDEGFIDATYVVDYPRFGDSSNGTWTGKKKVEIKIFDIGDVEED